MTSVMKPGDFKCIDDLKHFPIIGKDDIMHDYDSFLASGLRSITQWKDQLVEQPGFPLNTTMMYIVGG